MVAWTSPAVLTAAVLIGLPVAIHFLARDRSRRVLFPSLRFLETSKLASVRRRVLQDLPLLAVRTLIVLVAVAALAGPIFVTSARQERWAQRVARAVVLEDRSAPPDDELRSAAVGATFARERLADAVRDAARWLSVQAPVNREIVVLSSFRRGGVDPSDFEEVPPDVGIRLVRTGEASAVREREVTRLQLRGDSLVRVTDRLTMAPDGTSAEEVSAEPVEGTPPISVTAAPADRAAADAALRALLRRGVLLPPSGLLDRIEIPWPGTARALAAAVERRLDTRLDQWEPERLTDAELSAMTRVSARAGEPTPVDAGDRRVLWGVALILIALETWMRWGDAWT
jgi:hypothetical protein